MKLKQIGMMGITALMLTACGGSLPEGKEVSELKNATTSDSVANLLGQGEAMRFWQQAAQDTTLKSDKEREAYIKGMLKGMGLVGDDEAYNRGLMSGVQAAIQLKEVDEAYELKTNKDIYLSGFAYGLKSDTAVNGMNLQEQMSQIGTRLEKEKEARDAKKASEALDACVKKNGLTRNGDYAYKMVKKGSGALLANGNMVLAELSIKGQNGRDLMPSNGAMPLEVGAPGLPQSVTNTLMMMSVGGEAVIYAPLSALGMRGNDPTELAMVTIKVKGYCNDKGEPSNEPVMGQAAKLRAEQAGKKTPAPAVKAEAQAAKK